MKTIKISLDLAKKIYKGEDEDMKKLVLENFTEEELTEHEQKKWENFGYVSGYYIGANSRIIDLECESLIVNRNVRPTKELAEAALALSQLCQRRDRVNGHWKADFTDYHEKYTIYQNVNNVMAGLWSFHNNILTFPTEEIRDQFMKDHRDLLEVAKPLL